MKIRVKVGRSENSGRSGGEVVKIRGKVVKIREEVKRSGEEKVRSGGKRLKFGEKVVETIRGNMVEIR